MKIETYKIVKLGLIKDGKCGATVLRAERIKCALKWAAAARGANWKLN